MAIEFDAAGKFKPLQYEEELAPFVDLLKAEHVDRYLEIGACFGGTFHRVMTALPKGSIGVTVDLPERRWGMPRSAEALTTVMGDLSALGYDVHSIFGDSKSRDVARHAAKRGPYDAVMIDGDHTYDGVRRDWLTYGQMGKIVAFHDIAAMKGARSGVRKLWLELKEFHRTAEFVRPGGRLGIGVLWNV